MSVLDGDWVNPGKGTYRDIGFVAAKVAGMDKDFSALRAGTGSMWGYSPVPNATKPAPAAFVAFKNRISGPHTGVPPIHAPEKWLVLG